MSHMIYQRPTVKAVILRDSKWRKRQEWLARVEATMSDPLDGAKPWIAGLHYKGLHYSDSEVVERIAELKELQTKRGLNIAEERTLLVFERCRAISSQRRRAHVMQYRARKAGKKE